VSAVLVMGPVGLARQWCPFARLNGHATGATLARMQHTEVSDDELVSQLTSLCFEGRRLLARLIVHLMEVEARGLDKKAACSSMWDFCIKRLGMSEGEASRRLNAMKLVRRFPSLLGRIERGEIHLSALKLLSKHLNESNADELLDAASGKTTFEVLRMVARRYPRQDVPTITTDISEPLSESRYMVQMTMSKEGFDNLQRAKDLMRHRVPNGDTATVIERALKALLERLEKERLGKSSRPTRRIVRPAKRGHIPQAVRREVFERDGEQCTYVDGQGRRCESRTFLELDHVDSRALGGSGEATNVRVRCRSHNHLHAEEVFGKAHVAERIHCRQRKAQRVNAQAPQAPQVPQAMPEEDTIDLVTRGLVNMGFTKTEVRRALDAVCGDHGTDEPRELQQVLREALAVLT
jgi:5-methylcytosine-specific restriction endonuclease McrA